MRHRLALFLALGAALGAGAAASGCRSGSKSPATPEVMESIRDFQVVWTRGGKIGYLKTYDVHDAGGPDVRIHYVEDLDFRRVGWIADDGQGERFDYPPTRMAEAKRAVFERVDLPPGSVEDQIRRILQLDPTTEIALQRATESDLRR